MLKVLAVDDSEVNLAIYKRAIEKVGGCEYVAFADSNLALEWCARNEPDLAIVDYWMPAPNGLQFIERFRSLQPDQDIPVVMITIERDVSVRYRALELGASDFLISPIDQLEFTARVRNLLALRSSRKELANRAVWLAGEVARATADIVAGEQETIYRLTKALEFRNIETGNHIVRMAQYSVLICKALGLSPQEQELMLLAAPMHDIGKIATPDNILNKPAALSDAEWNVMRRHAFDGYQMLRGSGSPLLQRAAEIAYTHHERFDGTGYPRGLCGTEIPLYGRICAVSDVFDALTSRRPYKEPWPVDTAVDLLRAERGAHFDPEIVDAFLTVLDEALPIMARYADTAPPASPELAGA